MKPSPELVPALGYHWLTPFYDRVVALTARERSFKTALLQQADIRPGQQILDLACGTGTLAIWAKQACPDTHVTGVDGDSAVLKIAWRKASARAVRVNFMHAFSHQLPFPDDHFDRALSSLFFHHLSTDSKQCAARELFRVLKPGGSLHVADWGQPSHLLIRALFLPVQLLDGFSTTSDNLQGRLPGIFRNAGFVEVETSRSFETIFGTLTLYRARKP